jgi:hypothetical protein
MGSARTSQLATAHRTSACKLQLHIASHALVNFNENSIFLLVPCSIGLLFYPLRDCRQCSNHMMIYVRNQAVSLFSTLIVFFFFLSFLSIVFPWCSLSSPLSSWISRLSSYSYTCVDSAYDAVVP